MQTAHISNHTSRLLNLPREIRDLIFWHVLYAKEEPPESRESALDRWDSIDKSTGHRSDLLLPERRLGILHDLKPLRFACAGLQLCNRQILAEIEESLPRKSHAQGTAGVTYKIDVMVYETQVFPTWTCLPAPPRYLQNIDVDLRVFQGQLRLYGDDLNFTIVIALVRLLRGFFRHGPQFIDGGQSQTSICIDVLTMRIMRAERHARKKVPYQCQLCSEAEMGQFFWVARAMAGSGILFARVNKIRVCLMDGIREYEMV